MPWVCRIKLEWTVHVVVHGSESSSGHSLRFQATISSIIDLVFSYLKVTSPKKAEDASIEDGAMHPVHPAVIEEAINHLNGVIVCDANLRVFIAWYSGYEC